MHALMCTCVAGIREVHVMCMHAQLLGFESLCTWGGLDRIAQCMTQSQCSTVQQGRYAGRPCSTCPHLGSCRQHHCACISPLCVCPGGQKCGVRLETSLQWPRTCQQTVPQLGCLCQFKNKPSKRPLSTLCKLELRRLRPVERSYMSVLIRQLCL